MLHICLEVYLITFQFQRRSYQRSEMSWCEFARKYDKGVSRLGNYLLKFNFHLGKVCTEQIINIRFLGDEGVTKLYRNIGTRFFFDCLGQYL